MKYMSGIANSRRYCSKCQVLRVSKYIHVVGCGVQQAMEEVFYSSNSEILLYQR